jgi:hypothetical protein
MAKSKFKIIYDLGALSEAERIQYLRDASDHFGLDPDLNAFDLIWMNSEDGGPRRLTVYARKGTTDLLRGLRGISVLSLVRDDGFPGCATFIATGKDATGRQEMATGSHSIEGLKGERLAAAIMTSQTRALRRLTLQFVSGGLLDVAEVNAQTTDISASPASLAQLSGSPAVIPPPTVAPSTALARDITPEPVKDMGEQIAKVYREGAAALAAMPNPSIAQNPPIEGVSSQEISANDLAVTGAVTAPKRKRGRPRKRLNTVDIASPSQQVGEIKDLPNAPTPLVVTTVAQTQPPTAATAEVPPIQIYPPATTQTTVAPATAIPVSVLSVDTPPVPPALSPEKMKEYRERLRNYSNVVLVQGGMMPSDGIGGVTMKLRKFASVQLGVAGSEAVFTEEQFESLFEFLDGFNAKNGAQALVQHIDKAIGATK